jgi:hypothetical protein
MFELLVWLAPIIICVLLWVFLHALSAIAQTLETIAQHGVWSGYV